MVNLARRTILFSLVLAVISSAPTFAADPGQTCEKAASLSLIKCVKKMTNLQRKCFKKNDAGCDGADPNVVKALTKLSDKVTKKCVNDTTVQAAGFSSLTLSSLIDRLRASCSAETASLVARAYGGPHGSVWASADDEDRKCIDGIFKSASKLITGSAKARASCVTKQRKSGNCDLIKTDSKLIKLEDKADFKITARCPGALSSLTALSNSQFLDAASAQSRCMTAIAHPDTSPLELDCGPRGDIASLPRGVYTQVILDEATWGTRCGDGSPFAFWIRPAPAGFPVENVVLQMQGGGVCILEADCNSKPASLFEALNDNPVQSGIMSNSTATSPFANWTKVFLPYCNQDLFIGGGATSNFSTVTVHRFGGVNTRGALRYLRDALWREMDTDPEGYRPDRIKMLFGGTSAGGFGALYNYHYVLDDLQWVHTSSWPDAALALDSGTGFSIGNLGILLLSNQAPLGWGALHMLPPYCKATNCGVGPVMYAASAPRLKNEPEQQFLVLSNQVDSTQVGTTGFPNAGTWINAMRQSYCDTQDTNGLRYFLPAITSSTHVIATKTNLFTGQSVDGILMRDWLDLAMTDGDSLFDAVEEGSLVGSISGVNAFPCSID